MTSPHHPIRARAGLLALVGILAIALTAAACGSAPTTTEPASNAPAATPTPAGASQPPASAPATPPSADAPTNPKALGWFAVPASDVVDHYRNQSFDCQEPAASSQAAGYSIVRCFRERAGTTELIGLVFDEQGVLGNAFAGILTAPGTEGPTIPITFASMTEFLTTTLGETTGTKASDWYGATLAKETERTAVDRVVVQHYRQVDANGVGYYVEVANEAFLTAPTP